MSGPQSRKRRLRGPRSAAAAVASVSAGTSPYFAADPADSPESGGESGGSDWELVADGLEAGDGGVDVLVTRSNKIARVCGDPELMRQRRLERELADSLHRAHVLCVMAWCQRVSRLVVSDPLLRAVCLSQIPPALVDEASAAGGSAWRSRSAPSLDWLHRLLLWFRSNFRLERVCGSWLLRDRASLDCATRCASARATNSVEVLALLMACCVRSLGIGRCRLVAAPAVLPRTLQQPQLTAAASLPRKASAAATAAGLEGASLVEFWCEVPVSSSTDSGDQSRVHWAALDPAGGVLDRPDLIGSRLARGRPPGHLIGYAFGVDAGGNLKDVTPRYVTDFKWLLPDTAKRLRAPATWVAESVAGACAAAGAACTDDDASEDASLLAALKRLPAPTRPADFKGHPLYAVQRHLLKYEVLHPGSAQPVGFLHPSGEPFYSRDCVQVCHTRETWLKAARVVLPGELPAKVVRARLSAKQRLLADGGGPPPTVELFGRWQTRDFQPPMAADGLVPKNEHGNVELFQPSMLPGGCVHVRASGEMFKRIGQLAKRLGIDAAPAMVGWEFHAGGWAHPVLDGWVVCAGRRCHGRLVAAWLEERRADRAVATAAAAARAVGNWARLTRGLQLRDRIRRKYGLE